MEMCDLDGDAEANWEGREQQGRIVSYPSVESL
jgi:hypothetical protein